MSILSRLKNKLQDPVLNETKIREFDDCMSLLKNENVELHKRIDQLEAKYKINPTIQQSHALEEHIRQLEQENGRLCAQNQCQREEYERFLDQLTTMVIRTAVMQENLRKDCASIYHVIERLSNSQMNARQSNYPFDVIKEARKRILNNSMKITNDLIQSSSSSSSLMAHRSLSPSDSWTFDLPFEDEETKPPEEKLPVLQRSETFVVSKQPSEKLPSAPPRIENGQQSTTRPSRLPFRCPTAKTPSSNTVSNNRSLSAQKASKLPTRTATSLNRQQPSTKKSYIPTAIASKRSIPAVSNSSIKKPINSPPPLVTQSLPNNSRSSSTLTADKNDISSPLNQCPRPTIEIIQSNDPIEPMKSTSSESSIEERQSMHKLLPLVQDEGYSTWSSIDVKDDVIKSHTTEKNNTDTRQRTMGFIKTWLDTTDRQCARNPVNEVESENPVEFVDASPFLCPFVRNRCSNVVSIPLASTVNSFSNKDISLDSLDSSQSKEQTITSSSSSSSASSSSSTFSQSETFEKLLLTQTLANLSDSTSSTSSTFNMSDYIEDHFIDHDDNTSENSSSYETTIFNRNTSSKAQKRLLFPGLLNRLIFFRRILSESDLQRKKFYTDENENQAHVYHSNIINEHSVEVNLLNTYGSETELHVWSHDCAEQRRFLDERQQQQYSEENQSDSNQQLAVERQRLLQQIYEYPWLLQENDLEGTTGFSSPTVDLVVPLHNPDFYQLCALTNSSSFVVSPDPNIRHMTLSRPSSVL